MDRNYLRYPWGVCWSIPSPNRKGGERPPLGDYYARWCLLLLDWPLSSLSPPAPWDDLWRDVGGEG